jgi:acetyl esterase/lipase
MGRKLTAFYLCLLAVFVLQQANAQAVDTLALNNVKLYRSIPYGKTDPNQNIDLYVPLNAAKPMPTILWIHGGAWEGGYKNWIDVAYLTQHGYAIASIEYRFSQTAKFPAQVVDCNEAIYFMWKNAAKYGLDTSRFVIGGASAGGHLASLIGMSANNHMASFYNDVKKESKVSLKAVLDFYGPADFNATHGKAVALDHDSQASVITKLLGASILDRPDLAKIASPVTYVDKHDPPVLILHGDVDELVPFFESQLFNSWLKLAGVKSQLVKLPGIGHAGPAFSDPEHQKIVLDFLSDVLKK